MATGDPKGVLAARCHEVQVGLGLREVPEFDQLLLVGMAVRLALHVQSLNRVNYGRLKIVATHFLQIPALVLPTVLELLEEVRFVRLITEGKTIKTVIETVPYYEDLYRTLGTYAEDGGRLNELEALTVEILNRLSEAPQNQDTLRDSMGADASAFRRAIQIGTNGSFVASRRARGRQILLSPTYFSENQDVFADLVASKGTKSVKRILDIVRSAQGTPLSIIQQRKEIGGFKLSADEIAMLEYLAEYGAVKPPAIKTEHSGENFFMFTPRPSDAALAPTKRDLYERAMAIVAAVRQGQFLPKAYAIRSPGAVLWALRDRLKLKPTTEFTAQYQNLVHLRIGKLVDVGNGFTRFEIIDNQANREALDIAYDLVDAGTSEGAEVDDDARKALLADQEYIDSLLASSELRTRKKPTMSVEAQMELDLFFAGS